MKVEQEDDVVLLRRALDVGDLPEDFDPEYIPQTGEEYLHYVMYEKLHCEEYLRATIDEDKLNQQVSEIEIRKGCESAPRSILPSNFWQNQQVEEFGAFRDQIDIIRETSTPEIPYFNSTDEFCRKKCTDEPIFTEMIGYNQNAITKLLEYQLARLDEIKKGSGVSRVMGIWIYAILARLEMPLTPERCFLIRELARKCSTIRSQLKDYSKTENYAPLNLIICLVARYFKQQDLSD